MTCLGSARGTWRSSSSGTLTAAPCSRRPLAVGRTTSARGGIRARSTPTPSRPRRSPWCANDSGACSSESAGRRGRSPRRASAVRRLPPTGRAAILRRLPRLDRHHIGRCLGGDHRHLALHVDLARLLVAEPLALIVAEDHLVVVDLLDVLGEERNLASTTRGVDDELRHGEPGRPAAQSLDDLEPFL